MPAKVLEHHLQAASVGKQERDFLQGEAGTIGRRLPADFADRAEFAVGGQELPQSVEHIRTVAVVSLHYSPRLDTPTF